MSDLRDQLLAGPQDAATLQTRLGISQATLSRRIARDAAIVPFGRARATRYALRRLVRGEMQFPLWQIDASGNSQTAGRLISVWPAGSYLWQDAAGEWLHCDGLPWFLNDMRPQGFLGRAWGLECARLLQQPQDIRLWHDDHCLLALSVRGSDLPGNLIVGEESYRRWLQRDNRDALALSQRPHCFSAMARGMLDGDEPGSSAGGEQPKFTTALRRADGSVFHTLVKFTPPRSNENSQRWCDLLRAEALALQLMHQQGLAAAQAELVNAGQNQLFLQVTRFDRDGEHGRRGTVSLEAVQAEFIGQRTHWPEALQALVTQKRLSRADARRGTLQWAFGRLIANSDMHAGNLSFFTDSAQLVLTPAYDMLPMSFAPGSNGHMRDTAPELTIGVSLGGEIWQPALTMAQEYWQLIAGDDGWSENFRRLAEDMLGQLARLAPQIARMG